MHTWTLLPGQGIRMDSLEVRFGKKREEIRKALVPILGAFTSHRADEDDYANGSLRLRFGSDELLVDIEMMDGHLEHNGLELMATDFSTLEAALTKRYGHQPKWNYMLDRAECPELGLSFASRFNMGGDLGDERIAWLMLQPATTKDK